MNITTESSPQPAAEVEEQQWLLLIHQLPPKPDYLRVKIRRRLQGLGALALKNTVYVLPLNEATMEDLQWLRREIVEEDGEASLIAARMLEGVSTEELIGQFRSSSDAEYAELAAAVDTAGDEPGAGDIARLRRQLEAIEARDYFGAAGRSAAHAALERADATSRTGGGHPAPADEESMPHPQGATWVTRKGVFVDRMASAWLIRRFIDPEARFRFVVPQGYRPEPGELRFDMFEGEFTHAGGGCTFETLLARFQLSAPGLAAVGEIVHDIDCKDEKFGRPEADWVTGLLRGVAATHAGDQARIDAAMALFDALHATLREADSGR